MRKLSFPAARALVACTVAAFSGVSAWAAPNPTGPASPQNIKLLNQLLTKVRPDKKVMVGGDELVPATRIRAFRDRMVAQAKGTPYRETRSAFDTHTQYWTATHVVPYTYDNLPASERAAFESAAREWEKYINIKFVPRTNETNYVRIFQDPQAVDYAYSDLGMIGGEQTMSLNSGATLFLIAHEIGHTLGLDHEHQRSDRDKYITIHYENCPGNEEQYTLITDTDNHGEYDFESIMHYFDTAFSTNGQRTMVCKPGYESHQDTMGGQTEITLRDRAGAAAIYGYPLKASISNASITEGNSGTKNLTFTVTLSQAATATTTINYATANGTTNPATAGTDYVATSGTLTFAAGDRTKTINVPIKGDTTVEPDETFFVNLSGATNVTLANTRAVGTILNDENVPANVSVTPATGDSVVGTARTLSATYSDSNGNADIAQARILVNASVSGPNSLYAIYDAINNRLSLFSNDATTLQGGFAPGSNNIISNSQGSLNCAATTVTRSGNTLTVNWAFTPSTSFAGNKNIYLYCRDKAGATDGFDDLGDWTIKTNSVSAPVNTSVTPNASTSAPGTAKSLSALYTDADGALDIRQAYILVRNTPSGTSALYATYDLGSNKLYLRDDANSATLGGFAPGSNNVISNGQGTLNCAATTVTRSGNTLTINWSFTPSSSFKGTKNLYLYCRDSSGKTDGFDDLGDWTIGAAASPSGGSG